MGKVYRVHLYANFLPLFSNRSFKQTAKELCTPVMDVRRDRRGNAEPAQIRTIIDGLFALTPPQNAGRNSKVLRMFSRFRERGILLVLLFIFHKLYAPTTLWAPMTRVGGLCAQDLSQAFVDAETARV